MENSTTIVETHSLTKRFGSGVLAVNSVDMSVRRGEVYGFLGPNGAGKSPQRFPDAAVLISRWAASSPASR